MAKHNHKSELKRSEPRYTNNRWYDIALFPSNGTYLVDLCWRAWDPALDKSYYGRTTELSVDKYSVATHKAEMASMGQRLEAFLFTGDFINPEFRPVIHVVMDSAPSSVKDDFNV